MGFFARGKKGFERGMMKAVQNHLERKARFPF